MELYSIVAWKLNWNRTYFRRFYDCWNKITKSTNSLLQQFPLQYWICATKHQHFVYLIRTQSLECFFYVFKQIITKGKLKHENIQIVITCICFVIYFDWKWTLFENIINLLNWFDESMNQKYSQSIFKVVWNYCV